jgi:hypothetical protein
MEMILPVLRPISLIIWYSIRSESSECSMTVP